jgi:tetratricopeptide (TPR) repeat protein
MRSRWLAGGLLLTVAAAAWGGWSWSRIRADRAELEQARRDVAEGRPAIARRRLTDLVRRRPAWDEAHYQLGLCEEARGQPDAALAAWSHVSAASPWNRKSAIARARILTYVGRYADAETVLLAVPRGRDEESALARQALERLYQIQGRRREIRELLVESWADSADPGDVLRRLYLLDDPVFPVESVRRVLEGAARDDDRVWLGRANLASWSGQLEEAGRWLDACLAKRLDDPAVWSARLDWARSTNDLDEFRRALEHLPASWFSPPEILRLRCWLAGRTGDGPLERRELLALTAEEPGDTAAWERLAELALTDGRRDEVERLRRTKAEMSARRERYATVNKMETRNRHAEELAQLAEALGRKVEARGWSLIRAGRAAREELRPSPGPSGPEPPRSAALMMKGLWRPASRDASRPARDRKDATGAAVLTFADWAEAAGLGFFHDNGHTPRNPPPTEPMCGGVGLLDYDGDGRLDLYVVQGGPFPPPESTSPSGDRLFRNVGGGRFEDASRSSKIAEFPGGYGHGVAVGDYDNDGRPDLFVTRWRSYALYRNRGDGTFQDVTAAAGLGGDRDWPTSSAFADLDGDGDLDLYVCHYLRYDPKSPRRCEHPESPNEHTCNPIDFPSLPDHVFRNDAGRFVDMTEPAGIVDLDGRGLGVVAADLDGDHRVDLFVANDMTRNLLFRNQGGFRFEEIGEVAGVACASDGNYRAGMGIACGDLDGDGLPDLAVTNYFGESTTFYRNLGAGLFTDQTAAIGLAGPSRPLLGFGAAFFDANNDGWLDLITANGHVVDNRPRYPWTMPLQLLLGSTGGRLTDVSKQAGAPFQPLHLGRGLAVGDLDHDGRPDVVVVVQNEPLVYLHNESQRAGHFIVFQLEGTRSNRDAVGARVAVTCGGRVRVAHRIGGGSYQSSSDPRLHFGLADQRRVDSVEVRWPSGQVDHFGPLEADTAYRLVEGSKAPRPLEGWAHRP